MPNNLLMVVHAGPSALGVFKSDVLPRLLSRGVTVAHEEPTALCLRESKADGCLLPDACHGISLLHPALAFFYSYERERGGQQLWYVRDGETLAQRVSQPGGPGSEPLRQESGPVGFIEAALTEFCQAIPD